MEESKFKTDFAFYLLRHKDIYSMCEIPNDNCIRCGKPIYNWHKDLHGVIGRPIPCQDCHLKELEESNNKDSKNKGKCFRCKGTGKINGHICFTCGGTG